MTALEKLNTFVRCHNSLDVPESMCKLCLRTLVAPDLQALELAEIRHTCASDDNTPTHDQALLRRPSAKEKSLRSSLELLLWRSLA